MYNTFAYTVYLLLALAVVLIVGGRLYRDGRFYLVELFHDEQIADAVNRFLYVGYCLLNIGGAFRCLARAKEFDSFTQAFEYVAENQGQLLLLLGLMHALNLAVLPALKNFLRAKLRAHHTEQPKSNR